MRTVVLEHFDCAIIFFNFFLLRCRLGTHSSHQCPHFLSIRRISAELSEARKKAATRGQGANLRVEIRQARIETMKREFRLLFYSLDGAQVFFKDRD